MTAYIAKTKRDENFSKNIWEEDSYQISGNYGAIEYNKSHYGFFKNDGTIMTDLLHLKQTSKGLKVHIQGLKVHMCSLHNSISYQSTERNRLELCSNGVKNKPNLFILTIKLTCYMN